MLLAAPLLALVACSTTTAQPEPAPEITTAPTEDEATTEPPVTQDDSEETETPADPPTDDTAQGTAGPEQDEQDVPGGPVDVVTDPGARAAALALAPGDTTYLTITDWTAIKARRGAEDLTSESLMTDRLEFWRSITHDTVLLTDGALRDQNSLLDQRYGVTQDDVRWEVRWAADQEGGGMALRLRDDLDLEGLQRAVTDEVPGVAGAEVIAGDRLLVRGAGDPMNSLAVNYAAGVVMADAAETQVVVPGCLSWPSALGADATVEDQEGVAGAHEVDQLLDLDAWSLGFAGRSAIATLAYPEGTDADAAAADAAVRVALAQDWPTTESIGWNDAFGLPPELDAETFEVSERGGLTIASIDYRVVNPTAAANVTLAGLVPIAVCSEIDWLAEPTGL